MRTQQQITKRLKQAEKELKDTRKRFELHDNSEDMDATPVVEAEIALLKWVLEL